MVATGSETVARVKSYWDDHTLGLQYVKDQDIEIGSKAFFDHIRPWMNPYKFPEIMPRISALAAELKGRHILEVGCGMGFDTVEFLKRGVTVTATDLTQSAVDMTKRHLATTDLQAETVQTENVLNLSFPNDSFDGVWACGVVHHTGDTRLAIQEIRRVLKPGGYAMIMHMYRRPSWMYYVCKYGKENIEFKEEDAPVTHFVRDDECLEMFEGLRIREIHHDHYRCLPIARKGVKAALYSYAFKPGYNLMPEPLAKKLAYKLSVVAIKE